MDSLLIKVLLFVAVLGGLGVLLLIAHYTFYNHEEMYIDIRRFRKDYLNRYK